MIPTFIGITLLAFCVMQIARQDAYQQELRQAQGSGGSGGEGGASQGGGDGSYSETLSLEQIERLKRRYEMHLPVALNVDVLDRSDWANRSLEILDSPIPQVASQKLFEKLKIIEASDLEENLENYLKESENVDHEWYYDQKFADRFTVELGSLDSSRYSEVSQHWEEFRKELEKRVEFRQKRDKAHRDLLGLRERLIVCLLPEIFEQNDQKKQTRAFFYLQKVPLISHLTSIDELSTWWAENEANFSQNHLSQVAQNLLNDSSSTDYRLAMQEFKNAPSLYASFFYEMYDKSLSLETRRKVISFFEKATKAEGIPYIEVLDEARLLLTWNEVEKWWRKNRLKYVEISPIDRATCVLTVTRYGGWLFDILHLDFRQSESLGVPVLQAIESRLPISVQFGLTGFLLSYLVCIPLGVMKAIRHGSTFDFESSFLVFVGYSIPGWALGAVLLMVFSGSTFPEFDWFPLRGYQSDHYDQLDFWSKVKDRVWHGVLPTAAYALGSFATLTVLMKNFLMENLGADYVRTAFAKGLSERRVIFIHTLRNSLIPLCVGLGHMLSILLAGSYLIEKVFEIHGFGLMGYNALLAYDINLLMGVLVMSSLLRLWGNLFSDILYSVVDPRIRFK